MPQNSTASKPWTPTRGNPLEPDGALEWAPGTHVLRLALLHALIEVLNFSLAQGHSKRKSDTFLRFFFTLTEGLNHFLESS